MAINFVGDALTIDSAVAIDSNGIKSMVHKKRTGKYPEKDNIWLLGGHSNYNEDTGVYANASEKLQEAMYKLNDIVNVFVTKGDIEEAVEKELKRQFTKWGIQHNTVDQWNSYLLEEYGEAVKEMNDASFEPDLDKRREMWDNAIKESTEMIAVAVNWIHEMKRRRDAEG